MTALDDFINRARVTPIVDYAVRAGARFKRLTPRGGFGACPVCKGDDRFSVDTRKGVFYCRGSGAGGDVIALAAYVAGVNVRERAGLLIACEAILREPAPTPTAIESAADKAAREAENRARDDNARLEAEKALRDAIDYRETERAKALAIWQSRRRDGLGVVADYLRARGIRHLDGLRLGCVDALPYWSYVKRPGAHGKERGRWERLGDYPAMVAPLYDRAGRFCAVACTYLDPAAPRKALILDPVTGEALDPKKTRGSTRGEHDSASGRLTAGHTARMIAGEGVENVLSVRDAWIDAGRDPAEVMWWFIGGMPGGAAAEQVLHPDGLTKPDAAGRQRRIKIKGPAPDLAAPWVAIPDGVEHVTWIRDGDCDPWAMEFAIRRMAARWARPGRIIAATDTPRGLDMNDLRRAPPSSLESAAA